MVVIFPPFLSLSAPRTSLLFIASRVSCLKRCVFILLHFPFLFLRRIPSIRNEEFSDLREVVIVSSVSFRFFSDKRFKTSNFKIYDISE